MNYYIFGGSGFIGTNLINLLYEKFPGYGIFNLDIIENNHNGKSRFVYCDVRNKIEIDDITVTENDVVFNFAAVHTSPGHPDFEYFETNIKGAENVTRFADQFNIKKIIFTSSIAPYGASEDLKTEETLPTPNTPYGISKFVAEKIHMTWQNKIEKERQLTILRPGVVFGKGENGNFTRLYWGIKGRKFLYPGRKDTVKACIYVKEVVNFMLFRLDENKTDCEIYNCAYFPAFTIEEIAETMMKVTGTKRFIPKIPASILKSAAVIVGNVGGKKLGIHPDRVKKLMISTNISGEKLAKSPYIFKYTFEEALNDWYEDNDKKFLK